jgi:hypothetical protein
MPAGAAPPSVEVMAAEHRIPPGWHPSVRTRRWLIDMLLIAGGVISLLFEPLAIAIHSIVGLIFVGAVGPHLWHRRAWIRAASSRIRQRCGMPPKMRWGAGQAVLLFVLVIIVTVSGLWDWLGVPTKTRWHALSSLVLIAVVSWHAWTRRRWLVRRRPPGDASARPAAANKPAEPQPAEPQP